LAKSRPRQIDRMRDALNAADVGTWSSPFMLSRCHAGGQLTATDRLHSE
jgi:hypothetical protein